MSIPFSVLPEVKPMYLVLGIAVLGLSYILSLTIYRLFFHPYAKYPGPLLAKISVWPSFYHSLKGDRHVWLWQCQQKYGTSFRYTPDIVSLNTPAAYRNIYGTRSNVKKANYYDVWPQTLPARNTWNETEIGSHVTKRRVLNNAFSDRAVRSAEPFVIQHVDRWCDLIVETGHFGSSWTPSINMAEWSNYLVLDMFTELCFGKSFHIKEPGNEKYRFVPHLMTEYAELLHLIASSPIGGLWARLKPLGLDRLFATYKPQNLKIWDAFVASCLKERTDLERQIQDGTSKQPARRDIFHHIFEGARDPATGRMSYSDTELHMECELMLIAGSDTTSTAMAAMLFYLGVYPEVQAKLAEELRATFAKRDDIRMGPVMNSCQYLHAVINETLRMSSPVSTDLIREILPGGLLIDGQYYDQGALVSTSNYCLFYNDDVYHDPFTFDPERWIVNDQDPGSAARVALAESAFCSFSTGPRGCVGKNLALMELSMVSARLFHMFEVRLDDKNKLGGGNPNMMWGRRKTRQYQVKDAFIVRRDGPMVQFRLRK